MSYSSLMHVAFHTDRMDEMVRFYTEVLGGKLKVVTRYGAYLERDDRPAMQAAARIRPDDVFNVYVELAPGQFIEFFFEGTRSESAYRFQRTPGIFTLCPVCPGYPRSHRGTGTEGIVLRHIPVQRTFGNLADLGT